MLNVRNLGRYLSTGWIWKDISFNVLPGDRFALKGPSGSGKTLLLRVLAGLDDPQAGTISFRNRMMASWAMPEYRSQVMYLPQRPAIWEGSVEFNLQTVFRLKVFQHRRYDQQRILEYLSNLGRSSGFLNKSHNDLSGGESQIVAFLRVLQLNPQIILFDEPTASLDPNTVTSLEQLVQMWHTEDAQRAYIWTSHDPAQLEHMTETGITLGNIIDP